MRRKLAMILAVLTVFMLIPVAGGGTAEAAADYSNIRVLLSIGSGVQSFGMSVTGSYFIKENGYSFTGGTLTAQLSGSGVVLTHSSAGQIYAGSSVNIMREKIDPSAGNIRCTVGGSTRNYLGHFMIKPYGTGLRIVNTVPMAHYLYGVVRGEMGNAFPPEALKAQAIAAKCYVIAGLTPTSDYDIGDTAEDQVYKGYIASETNVINAVNATYDIGLYLGNDVLRAFYAASNGGSTLIPSQVWSGTDRYKWDRAYASVTDPYDPANPLTPQETILLSYNGDSGTNASVASRLKSAVTASMRASGYLSASDTVSSILQISAVEKISTYNAYITMSLQTSSGQQTQLRCGVDMRELMSSAQRKSMRLFIVTQVSGGFQIYQGRYGHGVGLSQRGAEQMANQGMKYDAILKFYYPGATLRSMGITAPQDPTKPAGSGSTGQTGANTGTVIATAVTTAGVNFRKGPSASTEKLGTVPKGTSLEVYAQESNFSYTQYNGKAGYVSNDYLKITPVSTGGGTAEVPNNGSSLGAGAKGRISASEYTLMRSQASNSGTIVAKLLKDVVVDILSESGNYYYAQVKGYQGYVLKSDITVTSSGSSSSGSSSSASSGGTSGSGITAYGETTGKVNFRTGAGTSHSVIKMLAKGTKVDIYSKSGSWYHVSVNGTDGYLSTSYVKETGKASGSTGSGDTGGSGSSSSTTITAYGETTGSVNFRTGPGTSHSSIKMLKKGTKLDIYGLSGGWYHVSVDGKDGYISASYVKETGKPESSAGTSGGSTSGTTVYKGIVVNEWVWLRSSPEAKSDQSNALRQIAVGTEITVYADAGNNFYRVSVDGQEGYVSKDYVRVTGETSVSGGSSASSSSSSASTAQAYTTGSVRLRSTADSTSKTNILTVLGKGAKLTIHGDNGNGWYEVTYGSQRGFVSKSYVKAA